MFGRKRNVGNKKDLDYSKWSEDFGFLSLIMNRKKKIIKEYVIKVYSQQLSGSSYIRDEDIDPLITECVTEVLVSIGENYKEFLIDKYFGSERALVSFITEDYYADLVSESINTNNNKILKEMFGKKTTNILKLNEK